MFTLDSCLFAVDSISQKCDPYLHDANKYQVSQYRPQN